MSQFLDLTNRVLTRLNEVPLNSTNFAGATGFQLQAQQAVLDAIRKINSDQYCYPWLHTTKTAALSAATIVYPLDATIMVTDWDTFNIQPNPSASPAIVGKALVPYDYHQYKKETFPDDNFSIAANNTTAFGVPNFVIQDQAGNFIVSPVPDRAYTVNYEGWAIPTDMVNYNDPCPIPDRFLTTIIDGSMYYAYLFRDNIESAQLIQAEFKKGLDEIRLQVAPPIKVFRDTRAGPQFYNKAYSS